MLNRIWFWLLLLGILYGFGKSAYRSITLSDAAGRSHGTSTTLLAVDESTDDDDASATSPLLDTGKQLSEAAVESAKLSVEICLGLIGIMALWLGLLKIANDAGMVQALAALLRPAMRWLFPDVPDGHPGQAAMVMNIAANILGLDNAATPFGLKAMRELQALNSSDDTATDAMATFLAINTSSVTLVPVTIIALRAAAGSSDATRPMAGMILATCVSTIVAIVAVKALARTKRFSADRPRTITALTTANESLSRGE
ncbi:MAG: nucleoside recognition domain-containing protein [Pirellulaceae bacterium]|nr:hypothetical protein [Planctomycetales bacterium]